MGKLGLLGLAFVGCVAPMGPEPAALGPHATFAIVREPLEIGAGGWTSPWTAGPFAFDELLPSWNVRHAPDVAFRFELQVRAGTDSPPTPWLDLGGWGEWPEQDLAATRAPGVRVEVDLFKSDALQSGTRLRLRAEGPLELEALCLCFTRSGDLAGLDPKGKRRRVAQIPVPQRRQTDEAPPLAPRICSPTAVNMLLAFEGVECPTSQLAAELYDRQHDIYGNWNRAVQGTFERGVKGHLTRLADWNEVADWLAGGTPLIASVGVEPGQLRAAPYQATAGHLLVICGLDGEGRALVLDPAVPAGELGPRRYLLEDLDQVWLRRGGFAYVLGQLPRAGPLESAAAPFKPGN